MSDELRSLGFTVSVNGQEKGTSIVAIVKSVEQLGQVESELNKTAALNTKITKDQTVTQKAANATARATVAAYKKQQASIDKVTSQIQQETKMLLMSSEQQKIFNAQMRAGVDPMSSAGRNIETLMKKQQALALSSQALDVSSKNNARSFRGLRGQAQNLGWQMQDVAVQMQMGTDSLVIFSQQGSQVASGFGPWGAVAGAVIAVGGAIAGAVFSTKDLKEAQELAKVTTIGLTKELYEQAKAGKAVTNNQKAYLITLQEDKVRNYKVEMAKLNKSLLENQAKIKEVQSTMGSATKTNDEYMKSLLPGTLGVLGQKLKNYTKTVEAQKATIDGLRKDEIEAQKNLENLKGNKKFEDQDALVDKLKSEAEQVEATAKQWRDKIATIGLSERQVALYTLTADASNKTEKEAIAIQSQLINEYYDKKDAIEAVTKAEKERAKSDAATAKLSVKREKEQTREMMKRFSLEERAMIARASLMDKIQKGQIQEQVKDNPFEAENKLYKQNLDNLQAMKSTAGEYSITEQIRINGLIESEESRHTSAMQSAFVTQARNYASLGSMVSSSMTATVDIFATGGEEILSQMEEMNGAQKAAFIFSQAIAAANALIGGYELGIDLAKTMGWGAPAGIAFGTGIGAAQAGAIMGVTMAGAFDEGGVIPAGQAGIVSEYGDELVGGTMVFNNSGSGLPVTGREDTAKLLSNAGGQSGGLVIQQNITVQGNGDKALSIAMKQAAKQGAKEGYAMVAKDLKNNRGVSSYVARSK